MKDRNLKISLLALRLGVFSVMLVWTIDKFLKPGHTAAVFKKFYLIDGLNEYSAYAIGAVQLAIILFFILGLFKRFSYGLVLLLHSVSTFSSWTKYINPWENGTLLFYTAIPMLSACLTLYLLRDEDTLLTIKEGK